jgi:peptidoglycan-N-acetylglucosamine deacetylase
VTRARPAAIACLLVAALVAAARDTPAPREVAITFDDLPIAGVLPRDIASSRALTTGLLRAIGRRRVPVTGFVNEDKVHTIDGSIDRDRVGLLERWLDAGAELGNHGYSHLDLHSTPIDDFEADVAKGEAIARRLSAARGRPFRFFRHPFLHTGRSVETRAELNRFLTDHGYRVAPVTIDNDEYIFAGAYDRALARGARGAAARVADAYVPYMEAKVVYFERNARELFGRDIRQILLVHANMLNADRFGDLAAMFERHGYRFITLERALEDPAYQSADTYVGPGGITWLHRWALTRAVPKTFFAGEPETPAFVAELARP